ncbi:MAG: hypothetical protein H6851_13725 [Geminicoccaceae bacterium]|nr:hypothetical protein [Geminicoccaceae bacterium]
MRGMLFTIFVLFALLISSAAVAWYVWTEIGDVEIGLHGQIALLAGVSATFLLGVGLMWLVYYSHHKGYDDEAGHD